MMKQLHARLRVLREDMQNPVFGGKIHNDTVQDLQRMLLDNVDTILQSLSLESVRSEALNGIIKELAEIADACVDLQQNRNRPDSDPVMGWDNAKLTLGTLRKARAIQSTARVAEGESVPDNAVEIAAYRRALERIIRDDDCDPVQIAHQAITPYTDWKASSESNINEILSYRQRSIAGWGGRWWSAWRPPGAMNGYQLARYILKPPQPSPKLRRGARSWRRSVRPPTINPGLMCSERIKTRRTQRGIGGCGRGISSF